MNTYKNVSNELRAFFAGNRTFKVLLPLDIVFIFFGLLIVFLYLVTPGAFLGYVCTIAYYVFLLGLLLAYANGNHTYLYGGFFGYAAISLIAFFIHAFSQFSYFDFSSLVKLLVYGGLGYLVFKRSLVR